MPQPDYSSQLMITELMLAKYCGAYLPSVPKPLVQTLAHIGKYYTPKFIEKAVRMTCTPRRLQRLARKPLSVDEFVPALASFDPVYRENFDENTRSRVIDLPGARRRIKRVDFRYRTRNVFTGFAEIEVWGKK